MKRYTLYALLCIICFFTENFIIKNANKIKHIPTVIVHGRYDFVCMPSAAIELKKALGSSTTLHLVADGHGSSTVQREVVKAYQNLML